MIKVLLYLPLGLQLYIINSNPSTHQFYSVSRFHRALACDARKVRYCFSTSVRLSVRHILVLYLNECTKRQDSFHRLIGA